MKNFVRPLGIARPCAAFVICVLALAHPAYALRSLGAESPQTRSTLGAGLEEMLSGEQAAQKIQEVRRAYESGAPFQETSRRLSRTILSLIRGVESEALRNLQDKNPVRIELMDGSSRVRAYPTGDPNLSGHLPAEYAAKDYFIVATGSLGRQDDFVLGSDADFIVFPSNPESVAYAQALQSEMTQLLKGRVDQYDLDLAIDERLTGMYDFQVPPEAVPEKLLVARLLVFDNSIGEMLPTPSITSHAFRDMAFLSGDRAAFDRLSQIAAPYLYPYGQTGDVTNPQGSELIEQLLSSLRNDTKEPLDGSHPEAIDLKENLLRPIQMTVWIMRARGRILAASVFEALNQMEAHGAKGSQDLAAAYEFFLRARDLLYELHGKTVFVRPGQQPDYRIPKELQPQVAQRMGLDLKTFLEQFKTHAEAVRTIIGRQLAGLEEWKGLLHPDELRNAAEMIQFQIDEASLSGAVTAYVNQAAQRFDRKMIPPGRLVSLILNRPEAESLSMWEMDQLFQEDREASMRRLRTIAPITEAIKSAVREYGADGITTPRVQGMFSLNTLRHPDSKGFIAAGEESQLIKGVLWLLGVPGGGVQTGLEEIRFEKTGEDLGVHGFLLEGQGIRYARLFALAAARGLRVPFAGVATAEQIRQLEMGLSGGAGVVIHHQMVASDGIGQDAARQQAERVLRRSVALKDRPLLVITRVTELWDNLAEQVRQYLRLVGLRLKEDGDRQRALELLRSA